MVYNQFYELYYRKEEIGDGIDNEERVEKNGKGDNDGNEEIGDENKNEEMVENKRKEDNDGSNGDIDGDIDVVNVGKNEKDKEVIGNKIRKGDEDGNVEMVENERKEENDGNNGDKDGDIDVENVGKNDNGKEDDDNEIRKEDENGNVEMVENKRNEDTDGNNGDKDGDIDVLNEGKNDNDKEDDDNRDLDVEIILENEEKHIEEPKDYTRDEDEHDNDLDLTGITAPGAAQDVENDIGVLNEDDTGEKVKIQEHPDIIDLTNDVKIKKEKIEENDGNETEEKRNTITVDNWKITGVKHKEHRGVVISWPTIAWEGKERMKHNEHGRWFCTMEPEICKRTYGRSNGLWLHMQEKHMWDGRGYKCGAEDCDKSFGSKTGIMNHIREYHLKDEEEHQYECRDCGQKHKNHSAADRCCKAKPNRNHNKRRRR